MAGLFDGLELGKRALSAQQLWLNTIGHNISNVNTPGYTRQRVTLNTTYPMETPVGLVGTGVMAIDVNHVRDLFLNQQYRQENKALGEWTSLEKTLSQVEAVFSEPNSDSLGDLLDNFWAAWSDLANNPESVAARTALKEQTNLLTNGFQRVYAQLTDLRLSVDKDIDLMVDDINNLSTEIASLNQQIVRAELDGDSANDLRDRRDYLIDQLSQYVNVSAVERENNSVTVMIGSLAIVDGSSSLQLGMSKVSGGRIASSEIVWAGTDKTIKVLGGQLKGLIETRDEVVPKYLERLDDLAETLVTSVNALHRNAYGLDGSTGLNFFDPLKTSASNIQLDQMIELDVNRIAASQGGEVGDNVNALAIADLKNTALMMRGTASINEFYNAMIGELGVETGKAKHLKENYELLVEQIENARQSVQGVSLDEETTQLIKYQHAYDAAARVITVMDQALDTVINNMGMVGR
jgi:flagellar hook-associated protein 1 FlgK